MEKNQFQDHMMVTEEQFVEIYGEYPVAIEGLPVKITVNTALAMEDSYCTATPEQRTDETARLKRLAAFVGLQSLRPEHQWLLSKNPTE